MTRKGIYKAISKFIKNNDDIIDEFNQNGEPFESYIDSLTDVIFQYASTYKFLSVDGTLLEAMAISLSEGISIINAVDLILQEHDSGAVDSALNIYFRDLGKSYKREHNAYDQMVIDNTKMVISVAQKYTGLGLTLGELISAGNLGLLTAREKFDESKAILKDTMLSELESVEDNDQELNEFLNRYISYGPLSEKLVLLPRPYNKNQVREWVDKNVKNAKFSSVSMMWIKAFILMEIDAYSRVVKKPKSDIYKDRSESGGYIKEQTKDIFELKGSEGLTFGDTIMEGESGMELDVLDAYNGFKDNLLLLFDGLSFRVRNIILKKFGIGLPRPLTPKEIADQEGLTVARVSQLFSQGMETMKANAIKHDINPSELFEMTSLMR